MISSDLYFFLFTGEEVGLSIDTHINYVDKTCCSPLHLAVRGGNLEVIKLCIAHGAKIDQQQVRKVISTVTKEMFHISIVTRHFSNSATGPQLFILHVVRVPPRLLKSCCRLTIKCATLSTSLTGPIRRLYISTSALHLLYKQRKPLN